MLGILALILTGFFYLFIRPIVYIAFDREFARSQKIPVEIFEYVLMMFIALTIVACLRMVGIVLAISLLTIPQMTANLFTYSFKQKTAYEMRESDWSSDVCSSDLAASFSTEIFSMSCGLIAFMSPSIPSMSTNGSTFEPAPIVPETEFIYDCKSSRKNKSDA